MATTAAGANGIGKMIMIGKPVWASAVDGYIAASGVVDIPCVVVVE